LSLTHFLSGPPLITHTILYLYHNPLGQKVIFTSPYMPRLSRNRSI